MRIAVTFFSLAFLTCLLLSCGSENNNDGHDHARDGEGLPSDESWIRDEPIDVKALDADHDGFVYQDPMDWNVIADQDGRCPKCGMRLKRVPVAEATENLEKFGFRVAGTDSEGERAF
jgi:hypothetical protein